MNRPQGAVAPSMPAVIRSDQAPHCAAWASVMLG